MNWTISHEQDWISASVDNGSDSVEVIFTALSDNNTGLSNGMPFLPLPMPVFPVY
jgi:hypothetical protein